MKKSELTSIVKEIVAEILKEYRKIDEDSTTGGVAGYNIPAAFSRKGGSKKAVAASKSLGFTPTSIGQDDMNVSADTLQN